MMSASKLAICAACACLTAPAGHAAGPAAPVSADELIAKMEHDFPPGSLADRASADRALMAARAVHTRLQREFEIQSVHCSNVFFVNRCMDAARRTQRAGEHLVRALTLEAHDLQRRLDGVAHAKSRENDARQQAADDLLRPERERQAQASARLREQNAAAREEDEKRDLAKAAQDSALKEAQARQHQADLARKDALRPGQEAASRKDYQDKQAQAVAYAKTRADDREANAKRRAEREAARAAEDARSPPVIVPAGEGNGAAPH